MCIRDRFIRAPSWGGVEGARGDERAGVEALACGGEGVGPDEEVEVPIAGVSPTTVKSSSVALCRGAHGAGTAT
eukprot:584962-Alexandrium_andersonii.AAC.1